MASSNRVLITGSAGFVGQHVTAAFEGSGWTTIPLDVRDGDLREPGVFRSLLHLYGPDAVVHLAARCGGIGANMLSPADYFRDNSLININVVHECAKYIKPYTLQSVRLVCAGSICAYPHTPPVIPFREEHLHCGYPEETNAPYGLTKRDVVVMLDAYRQQYGLDGVCLMPTNMYGPGDHFDLEKGHVIPALIRKVLDAKRAGAPAVPVWGTGKATREFLNVRDAARAFVLAASKPGLRGPFNLGSGREVYIRDLTRMIADACNWRGEFVWDTSKPDGQPRRAVDSTLAKQFLGWEAEIPLLDGIRETVVWYERQGLASEGPRSERELLVAQGAER